MPVFYACSKVCPSFTLTFNEDSLASLQFDLLIKCFKLYAHTRTWIYRAQVFISAYLFTRTVSHPSHHMHACYISPFASRGYEYKRLSFLFAFTTEFRLASKLNQTLIKTTVLGVHKQSVIVTITLFRLINS